jgi:uncharacterized phiE125 gp8 family phage protein
MMTPLRPVRMTGPSGALVTLADVRHHLQSPMEDDYLLQRCIDAATARLDGYTGILGRCLLSQDWALSFCDFDTTLRLPFPDVSAIVSVKYFDEAGAEQTVAGSEYQLYNDARGGFVWFRPEFSPPALAERPDAVTVRFTAGYGMAADVPANIRFAIEMMAGQLYDSGAGTESGATAAVPPAVQNLIAPHRRVFT